MKTLLFVLVVVGGFECVCGRITYSENKTFVASSLEVHVLRATTSVLLASPLSTCADMSTLGFNPSIIALPRHFLDGKYYLASFRHTRQMCNRMCALYPAKRRRRRRVHTTLSVLDYEFREVRKVFDVSLKGVADLAPYEDVRLEAFSENRILATGMKYPEGVKDGVFGIFWIDLRLEGNKLVAQIRHLLREDKVGERNLGFVWNGRQKNMSPPFSLVYWLTPGKIDVRRGLGDNYHRDRVSFEFFHGELQLQEQQQRIKKRLSNSGSPVDVSEYCGTPDLLLAVGHYHVDAMPHGTTRWGNTYIQHLVLINASSYDRLAVSPPFCFPSLDQKKRNTKKKQHHHHHSSTLSPPLSCEIIQFVLSLLLLSDEKKLIFSYGANDCVPAYAQVPLDYALDFVDNDIRATFCPRLINS